MSDRPRYVVTFDDGREVEGEGKAADIIAFERRYQVPGFFLADPDHFRMEYQFFMGYLAVTRGWDGRPEFDDWMESVDAVTIAEPAKVEGNEDRPPLAPTA